MDENGHKRETSVYAGDALLAKQQVSNQVESVRFQHTNPITGSTVETKPDGTLAPDGTHEYDPQGNIVALSEPYQIASLRKQD